MLRQLRERLYVAACGRELAMERLRNCGREAPCWIRAEMRGLAVDSLEYRILERSLREADRLLAQLPDHSMSERNYDEASSKPSPSVDQS